MPADRLEEAKGLLEAYFSESPSGNLPPYDPETLEGQDPPPTKQNFITLYIAIALAAIVLFILETNLEENIMQVKLLEGMRSDEN